MNPFLQSPRQTDYSTDMPVSLLGSQSFGSSFLQSTVLQGTPLRRYFDHNEESPFSLALPKIKNAARWREFLKRKKMIAHLMPQARNRRAFISPDMSQNRTLMTKEEGAVLDPLQVLYATAISAEPIPIPEKPLRLRKFRGSCPRSSLPPEDSLSGPSPSPLLRRSADLSKPDLSYNADSHQTSITPVRALIQKSLFESDRLVGKRAELLGSSGILKAKKMLMRTHVRSKTNLAPISTESPNLETQHQKPPLIPTLQRKRLKPMCLEERKPTQEQLSLMYIYISAELAKAILESNGTVPRTTEGCYKCFIGPGNNSQLVSLLMKKRGFWNRVDAWQQADFIWTQNKQQNIVNSLSCCTYSLARNKIPLGKPIQLIKKATKMMFEIERKSSGISLICDSQSYVSLDSMPQTVPLRVYNRLERNYQLTSKKRLYLNMKTHCDSLGMNVFESIPLTFHIENGCFDPEYPKFVTMYNSFAREKSGAEESDRHKSYNLWIIKPGEATNCGHGIHVSNDLTEIRNLISERFSGAGRRRTYVVQKYIERPLLIHKRKFDIRGYGLLTSFNGHIQGYYYHDGYLRTSSKEFSLKNMSNRFIHLTNDAVQKKSEDYGKFEHGNKLSYPEFQKYLEQFHPGQVDFYRDIWPQIKLLTTLTFQATYRNVDPRKRTHTFEVLGYDFMIDEEFKVWLIEVNTNPCLALSSAYLARLIPTMLDNAFR